MFIFKSCIYLVIITIFISFSAYVQNTAAEEHSTAAIAADQTITQDIKAMEQDSADNKEQTNGESFIAEKKEEKLKKTQERIEELPKDVQEKIKIRQQEMAETRNKIEKMNPEQRSEVQANVESWFKSLSLEKQLWIKIRIEGSADSETKVNQGATEERSLAAKPAGTFSQ